MEEVQGERCIYLYLLKELDDDGVACAMYAYSITDGVIDDETLEKLREIWRSESIFWRDES